MGGPKDRVLVVGTTPDYVEMLRQRYPEQALFLTDRTLREGAFEETPSAGEEVLADLGDPGSTATALDRHLTEYGLTVEGVTCYDDESLPLAARLAAARGVPFPSEKAVWTSRSKFHSKRAWIGAGVRCPRVQTARDPETLEAVMDRLGLPLVLKPLTGSGSELVFWCRQREEARKAFRVMTRILDRHTDPRLYPERGLPWRSIDPRQDVLAEEGFTGPEYSCDFILDRGRSQLVRLSGKILAGSLGTGTTLVYYVADREETGISRRDLEQQLTQAAVSLGFESGLFMADFIPHRSRAVFLEISPRPAGDCLPWLVKASSGIDTLGLALDLARGTKIRLPDLDTHESLAAVRIFSQQAGTLKGVDLNGLAGVPGILGKTLYRRPGHRIALPPHDYSSRILGHVIFRPANREALAEEAARLLESVHPEVEP